MCSSRFQRCLCVPLCIALSSCVIVVSKFLCLLVLLLVCLVDKSMMLCAASCDVVLSAGMFVVVSGGSESCITTFVCTMSLSHILLIHRLVLTTYIIVENQANIFPG